MDVKATELKWARREGGKLVHELTALQVATEGVLGWTPTMSETARLQVTFTLSTVKRIRDVLKVLIEHERLARNAEWTETALKVAKETISDCVGGDPRRVPDLLAPVEAAERGEGRDE